MLDISAMDEALERAIESAGGLVRLAGSLGITKQAVSQWDKVPPLRVLAVERASGVPRSELRPDLYPLESESVSVEARA